MTKERKEIELLATQNKLDVLKKEAGIFKRNKLKTIGFGVLVTILGPMYIANHYTNNRSKKSTLETTGLSYLEFTILIAILYSTVIIIAHFVWKKQERKRLKALEEKIEIIKMELEVFYKE